ncbi:hypothetical protein FRB91_009228 [Serendipita sp. 411]|nr:hypothetical protein FRB91_009228 [Serendipita sp. 411]
MSGLQDKIYGREIIITHPTRKVLITGRGGSGNSFRRLSTASGYSLGGSSILTGHSSSSRAGGATTISQQSIRTRRWSSASSEFQSFTSLPHEVVDPDLYTISSHSTSTNGSEVLSDVPSFISSYTFKTASNSVSNPSQYSHSRPSTRSSGAYQRQSGHSEWQSRLSHQSYSSESLPAHLAIPEMATEYGNVGDEDNDDEAASIVPPRRRPASPPESIQFLNPFAWDSNASLSNTISGHAFHGRSGQPVYNQERRPSEIAPFDEPPPGHPLSSRTPSTPKTARKFSFFRKPTSPVSPASHDGLLPPPSSSYGSGKYGQSSETIDLRSTSMPNERHRGSLNSGRIIPLSILEMRRRGSNPLASTKTMIRAGSARDT